MSLLSWLLVTLAGLSLAIMVVSLTMATRAAREARATIFPIVREEETVRSRRARIVASVTGVIAATLAGAFFVNGQFDEFPLPTFTSRPSPEVVALGESPVAEVTVPATTPETVVVLETEEPVGGEADETPVASSESVPDETSTPVATPTRALPSPTPTPVPSVTSTPVPPSPTPAGTPVAAPAGVNMGPIAFTTQVSDRREPISPTIVFSDTVSRVYAVFPYSGMRNGLTWTQVWYFDDIEFSRGEAPWEWGSTDRSYVFTKLVGTGDYRVELYVNDELLAQGEFTVQGQAAVGGPENP